MFTDKSSLSEVPKLVPVNVMTTGRSVSRLIPLVAEGRRGDKRRRSNEKFVDRLVHRVDQPPRPTTTTNHHNGVPGGSFERVHARDGRVVVRKQDRVRRASVGCTDFFEGGFSQRVGVGIVHL